MTQCKVCYAIKTVDEADSHSIIKALEDDVFTNVDIAEVLTGNGFPISEASVRRHLNHKDTE